MLKIHLSKTPKLECLLVLKQNMNHENREIKAHDKFNFHIQRAPSCKHSPFDLVHIQY